VSIRVALDVTPELIASTGVARYSRELRRALEGRDDCRVAPFALGRRSQPVPDGVRHHAVPLRVVHHTWRAIGLPRAEQLAGPVDLVHSLDLVPPPTRRPLVVTVHDTVTSELPDLHGHRAGVLRERQLRVLERADAILAVSASTAKSLLDRGVDADRVHVTPNGLTRLPPPGPSPVPGTGFLLMVGTLEPRKGHDLLLRALARARLDSTRVVFAGPTHGRADELRALATRLGIERRLTILGHVDDAVLARLYQDAGALCMPSLAEGFGLPVLEALAAGVPVIASRVPAIREVAEDAALLVSPGDVDAFAGALERVLVDGELRARLRMRGRERAASFSWEATAEATVQAYRSALHRRQSQL
jgi:glycosyltransferase involved in cell wall biosynthesis